MTINRGGVFVTGTDTGVGKTLVCTLILQQLSEKGVCCAGMKPIASGCEKSSAGLRNADATELILASTVRLDYDLVNRYAFEPAIAPSVAASTEGVVIEPELIYQDLASAQEKADFIVVEGVGGWQVPISEHASLPDLAAELALPVILVVGIRLGCINHALLSNAAIKQSGSVLAGWVANHGAAEDENDRASIEGNSFSYYCSITWKRSFFSMDRQMRPATRGLISLVLFLRLQTKCQGVVADRPVRGAPHLQHVHPAGR